MKSKRDILEKLGERREKSDRRGRSTPPEPPKPIKSQLVTERFGLKVEMKDI